MSSEIVYDSDVAKDFRCAMDIVPCGRSLLSADESWQAESIITLIIATTILLIAHLNYVILFSIDFAIL